MNIDFDKTASARSNLYQAKHNISSRKSKILSIIKSEFYRFLISFYIIIIAFSSLLLSRHILVSLRMEDTIRHVPHEDCSFGSY